MNTIANPGVADGIVSKPRGPKRPINFGIVFSVVFHAVLILYLLHLVRPNLNILGPKPKQAVVELAPPPPPPPPPPKQQIPRTPPPPHPMAPPPPQQIVTSAPATTADVPTVPPAPPPAPEAPPAPPPRVVGTSVPSAYYNALQALIQQSTRYPKKSLEEEEEGDCMVRVTFGRDGVIEQADLVKKSGFSGLDGECREVFKRIGKFPSIPANANPDATDFAIELPINFALQ